MQELLEACGKYEPACFSSRGPQYNGAGHAIVSQLARPAGRRSCSQDRLGRRVRLQSLLMRNTRKRTTSMKWPTSPSGPRCGPSHRHGWPGVVAANQQLWPRSHLPVSVNTRQALPLPAPLPLLLPLLLSLVLVLPLLLDGSGVGVRCRVFVFPLGSLPLPVLLVKAGFLLCHQGQCFPCCRWGHLP